MNKLRSLCSRRPWLRVALQLVPLGLMLCCLLLAPVLPQPWSIWAVLLAYLFLMAGIIFLVTLRRKPPKTDLPEPELRTTHRVPDARRQQLLEKCKGDDPSLLRGLSLPELMVLVTALNEGGCPKLLEAFPKALVQALRKAPVLFLAMLDAPKCPYITGGVAWLFTRDSFCENAIDAASRNFLFLCRLDIPRQRLQPFLIRLQTVGCRHLLVDQGETGGWLLPIEELMASPPPAPKGPVNPLLYASCLEFFAALGRSRYLPDMGETLRTREEEMFSQTLKARFVLPLLKSAAKEELLRQIPSLESSKTGQHFLPVFTDLPELRRDYPEDKYSTREMSCQEVLELSKELDGFAVNPYGFNLVFHQKNLDRLLRYRSLHPESR